MNPVAEARVKIGYLIDLIRPTGDAFVHIGRYKAGGQPVVGSEAMM